MTTAARPVVLLVEDDEDDRVFFRRAVRKAGLSFTLVTASNGREAVEYLSGSGRFADPSVHPRPTHVLLDLKLPELSGHEVLHWIRRDSPARDLPVIILSSSREASDIERVRALGVDAYEIKPIELSALVETVRSVAARWNLQGAGPTSG